MRLLDLTLPTPAENLALDEALLDEADEGCHDGSNEEVLRLWEPREPLVVIGRSSQAESEVNLEHCRRSGIPVLRRVSGGAAIVTGPGCLMYALVLSYKRRSALRSLDKAHCLVLEAHRRALGAVQSSIQQRGTSDLALGPNKFSGNSVRCKRNYMLYHGTILYNLPLGMISQCLAEPQRQPAYRERRPHDAFVVNLPATAATVRQALITAWEAADAYADWPQERVRRLVAEKYSQGEWNLRL